MRIQCLTAHCLMLTFNPQDNSKSGWCIYLHFKILDLLLHQQNKEKGFVKPDEILQKFEIILMLNLIFIAIFQINVTLIRVIEDHMLQ